TASRKAITSAVFRIAVIASPCVALRWRQTATYRRGRAPLPTGATPDAAASAASHPRWGCALSRRLCRPIRSSSTPPPRLGENGRSPREGIVPDEAPGADAPPPPPPADIGALSSPSASTRAA